MFSRLQQRRGLQGVVESGANPVQVVAVFEHAPPRMLSEREQREEGGRGKGGGGVTGVVRTSLAVICVQLTNCPVPVTVRLFLPTPT